MPSHSQSVSAAWLDITAKMTGRFADDISSVLAYWLPADHLSYRDRVEPYTGEERSIVEFGAGYGGMAKALFDHGFRGVYTIIDLPEMVEMQKGWLRENCPDLSVVWTDAPSGGEDALLAHYSLSEAPFAVRDKLLSASGNIPMVDIIYPDRFPENASAGGENYNNEDYFAEALGKFFPGHVFTEAPMDSNHGRRAIGRCE